LPLPREWPQVVQSGVLHAISLASAALTSAWARASGTRRDRAAEVDRLRAEISLLREELDIKDERWSRSSAHKRPHYGPVHRLRILQLRASRGWTTEQTAQRFLVTEDTIAAWMRRLDEEGEEGLVRIGEPINKYPDFVGYLVRRLKLACPSLGKVRIAQVLARAGLHIGASTVGRMLKRGPRRADPEAVVEVPVGEKLRARKPHDVWHLDLTTIPTAGGLWMSWLPFALPQRWPFCWWTVIALDQASRAVMGFALFRTRPDSREVAAFLKRAARSKSRPKAVVTDKGVEFTSRSFKRLCRSLGSHRRFGAVGKHGSIAVIERFIRSMKTEGTRRIIVPVRLGQMGRELYHYASWYNEHRPHSGIGGATPMEVMRAIRPAMERPRFEPRRLRPRRGVALRGKAGARLKLALQGVGGRRHLPVVQLREAA